MIRKCEICNKEMVLRTVNKKGEKNFGNIITTDKNKRFCSRECQNKWQNNVSWEVRVGKETADRIRKETSQRVKGNKNPTCNPDIAKKVSEGLKLYLKEHPEERVGDNNAFYGKSHTEEYKKWAKESRKGKWSYNEEQYLKKIENQPRGENSPMWKGGTSFSPYSPDFNNKLKRKIKIRDNYQCCVCNKQTQKLFIHHINYDKLDSNEKNLISLCNSCHSKTNSNRDRWIIFFDSLIIEKYDNMTN